MSDKERLTRRDFFKLAFAASFGLSTGVAAGKTVRYFEKGQYDSNDKDTDYLKAIQGRIIVKNDEMLLTVLDEVRGEEKTVQVSVNKKKFSEEILRVAQIEDPAQGLLDTLSFLERNPLELELIACHAEPRFSPLGNEYVQAAGYQPLLAGGPKMVFFASYLRGYFDTVNEDDSRRKPSYDQVAWHEIYHLRQDIRNPYKSAIFSFLGYVNEFAIEHRLPQKLMFVQKVTEKNDIPLFSLINKGVKFIDKPFDYAQMVHLSEENEADKKSFQLGTDLRVEEIRFDLGLDKKPAYNFGQFFTFEEINEIDNK